MQLYLILCMCWVCYYINNSSVMQLYLILYMCWYVIILIILVFGCLSLNG